MRRLASLPSLGCELCILTLAFALRAIVVWRTLHMHTTHWFFAQASELGCLAESLRTGHGLSSPFGGATGPSAFLAPGYPGLVALIFRVCGSFTERSEISLMLSQTLFGVATVFAAHRVARRLFGERAALLARLAAACSPPLLFVPTVFWETSYSICFCACTLALAWNCADSTSRASWWWMALLTLLGAAVNPSLLTIAVPLWCWSWRQSLLRNSKSAWKAAGMCVVVMVLWPVRNWHSLHAFIPARTNMGYELWQGNRPGGDGFFSAQLHPNANATEFHRFAQLGEIGYMQEKSSFAKQAITARPMRFLALTLKRIACFWTGFGMTTSVIALAYTLTGSVFGLIGLVKLMRRKPRLAWFFGLPLALFPLPYYITHPDLRFRLVLDPVLLILAAYAVSSRRLPLSD